MYEAAVKSNGMSIEYVPRRMRRKEYYKYAVKSNGQALAFVPTNLITKELCIEAVKASKEAAVRFIPSSIIVEVFSAQ